MFGDLKDVLLTEAKSYNLTLSCLWWIQVLIFSVQMPLNAAQVFSGFSSRMMMMQVTFHPGSESGSRPNPPRPPPPEQNQTDSFLIAARLIREGWTNDRESRKQQLSKLQPHPNGSVGPQVQGQDSRTKRVHIIFRSQDKNTNNDKKTNRPEGSGAGRVTFKSGCRSKSKQAGRSKVTVLPVIAEV